MWENLVYYEALTKTGAIFEGLVIGWSVLQNVVLALQAPKPP